MCVYSVAYSIREVSKWLSVACLCEKYPIYYGSIVSNDNVFIYSISEIF